MTSDANAAVSAALARLRAAADATKEWPPTRWALIAGPGPEFVELVDGRFVGLELVPGRTTHLRCRVEATDPTSESEPGMEVMVDSVYRVRLDWNGTPVLEDRCDYDVEAAPSPALVQVVSGSGNGSPGTFDLVIEPPAHRAAPGWVRVHLGGSERRARFELLDGAWARLALAAEVANGVEGRAVVERAATRVDDDPLGLPTDCLAELVAALEDDLDPLADRVRATTVHLVGHAHIDLSWLWTWPDAAATVRRDIKTVLALMDEYPELTFTHSQAATYAELQREEPALFARVVERVRQGRWEPASTTWVEGDSNLAAGESIARQLLAGVCFSEGHLGVRPRVHFAPDSFGHAGNLPQLVDSAGADVYLHWRCNPGGSEPWPAYWWEGDDGTRVLAVTPLKYSGGITAGEITTAAIRAHRAGLPAALHLHGVGDHGGGPIRLGLEVFARLAHASCLPRIRCSTVGAYADDVIGSGAALPIHRGESATIFEGCYTTHSEAKGRNRAAENLLLSAESLSVLAGTDVELDEPWRAVLFNQFHDIVAGSSIAEVYDQHRAQLEPAAEAAADAIDRAMATLASGSADGAIVVANPLAWWRTEPVVVADVAGRADGGPVVLVGDHGHQTVGQFGPDGLCFVPRLPGFGVVRYRIRGSVKSASLVAPVAAEPAFAPIGGQQVAVLDAETVAEPPFLRVDTDRFVAYVRRDSGIIVSLHDRRTGRDLVAFGLRRPTDYLDAARSDLALNMLQVVEEHPHGMSAWHLGEVWRETTLLGTASSEVVETGPVRAVIAVCHSLGDSSITQRLAFYRELARIDVETDLDWRERGDSTVGVITLKAGFTVRAAPGEAWFETPFAATGRAANGQEVPALRWAAVGGSDGGVAVLNDGRSGHDGLGTRLRLTLVRGAYAPDATADVGRQRLRYAIVPLADDWRAADLTRAAAGFNQPFVVRVAGVDGPAGATPVRPPLRPQVEGVGVAVSALKRAARGGGTVVRVHETRGQTTTAEIRGLPIGARVWDATVTEERRAELDTSTGVVVAELRPWQVRTVIVDDP